MIGILTIIFAFIIFMIIIDKAFLAALRPVSFAIVIILSLFLGYILASIVAWIFSAALKIIIIVAIIYAIIFIFSKNK